jgi:GNAT superfamily N-acetyltransferase
MQWNRDAYTLDDDRARLDMPRMIDWIQASYWATGRPEPTIRRSWANAVVVIGLYAGDEQIGCARVVTDLATTAYLADVFILAEHRGHGLGLWLVETLVAHPNLAGLRWLLHTRDAHDLYRRAGFEPAGERVMERPRPQ